MNNAPCKGCADRFVGCHADCPKFLEFKERREQESKARRESKGFDVYVASHRKRKNGAYSC